jgi:CheY-like chemotaxis protein
MPRHLKILVVEDDQLTLEMIGTVLTIEGIEVIGLRDSTEGLALIEAQVFDGIFLDLTMPGLNGLDLTRKIRGSHHNAATPIVVITGRADSNAMKEAFAAGAHFFLSKPLDLGKLRHLVNSTHGTLLRERRRSHRVPMVAEISCRVGARSFTGVTSSINEQSVVFCMPFCPERPLLPGELVQISFHLPVSNCAVEAMGVIVRVDDRNTSCQFQKMAGATRKAVQDFLASFPDAYPENAPAVASRAKDHAGMGKT